MNSQSRENTVGFVGLGMMGGPMAENILKKGHKLVVYDIDKQKVDRLVALGAQPADGPADVSRQARIVISMVDTTAQAEEVIIGSGGFIAAGQAGDVVISMSTIDPMALRKMQGVLAGKGVDIIDSPVTGMEKGAKEGTLKAYVGGETEALEKARPVLEAMTSQILHLGDVGNGIAMKLVNNMLFQVNRVLIAEALALGAKIGLDPQQMVEVISNTTGNSVAFQYSAPRILAREFEGIRMDITYKDIELQTSLAKALKMPMFMANTAQQVYQMARAAGMGNEDGVAVVKIYEQFTGVPVSPHA
ncbi:NAD(P)-dependent oxidoreductase [Burkholderia sp. Bp9143]|uniref:NAD(P)-dependent oxidoreductase n=1 Tax=Burkholderia sp. Bp9143 TaxID=2184574 RepID=UPI000F59EBC3|nr:NAD(P)-dependent oxidoreductase [Burkholderia sp. Bp9143]RQR21285.1 NAD(P)-dependent oxidoreductase [Burkholderia sp. Bp9143]